MSVTPDRRTVLMSLAAIPALSVPAFGQSFEYALDDVVIGDPNAPLTVYEYVSFTCPHCANFHATIWPKVKENYVDTGKVKFILRDVYFNQIDLLVARVARCGGEKGFYPMADTYLSTQAQWKNASDPGVAILQVGRRAGLPKGRLEACIEDQEYAKKLIEIYQANREEHDIRSTPSFVIDGETITGVRDYDEFSAMLDEAL